jgi:hypothetical protein
LEPPNEARHARNPTARRKPSCEPSSATLGSIKPPDAQAVIESVPLWFDHYNSVHPQRLALSFAAKVHRRAINLGGHVRSLRGNNTPDRNHISTSLIERQNLTMRMSMRRFTRLTNRFSKKLENHKAAVGLHFAHYNYVRLHRT